MIFEKCGICCFGNTYLRVVFHVIRHYKHRKQVKTAEIKVFAGTLREILGIIIKSDCHGNRFISSLVLYLKMFVIVTAISVPSFMLVSKSVQFA